jgi:hypothetical protein
MLPPPLVEFTWKTVCLLDYGLPDWSWGQHPPTFLGDFQAIAFADPDANRDSVGILD